MIFISKHLAVCAVRGVLMACSIVPGLPLCVPGLTNPLTGRPDCDIGLKNKNALNKDLYVEIGGLAVSSHEWINRG